MPATRRWATTASPATAAPIARKTVPWTWELALSFSPSGLQASHRPLFIATGAPQRAHGWVWAGVAAGGTGVAGAVIRSMVPWIVRARGRAVLPSIGRPRARLGGHLIARAPGGRAARSGRRAMTRSSGRLPAVDGRHERIDVRRRPGEHDRTVGALL